MATLTPSPRRIVSESIADMCRHFALGHIRHYRKARAEGLLKSSRYSRQMALLWLAEAKGRDV